ncbi:MAG: diaminopimelate epimerase [Candidatus Pacebacteria bacterium]|nr:diaminopimelate epimerase [Candidatus Paceibacterota bacterium]
MKLHFSKYHGAGNDFVMIDNRKEVFDVNNATIVKALCHRHFGIGADGIILIENDLNYDFKMVFANNDGSIGSMCGNGGRCIVRFANDLGMIENKKNICFIAVDGEHHASIEGDLIRLKMHDVSEIGSRNGLTFLHSGTTPHHVQFVVNLESFPVCSEARKIRDEDVDPRGVNVNYVEIKDGACHVRTYERGVEDETLACGTGATSVAVAVHAAGLIGNTNFCEIKMPGGDLRIDFEKIDDGTYKNIWLVGPAVKVFEGEMEI